MNISDISPVIYRVCDFKYIVGEHKYARLHSEKSHYVYRLLCFKNGSADVYINGEKNICRAGDTLYLVPGEKYRLSPQDNDFSLYNIFFDFIPHDNQFKKRETGGCVFLSDYESSLCSPVCHFTDALEFNHSSVFKNTDCSDNFEALFQTDINDSLYPLYAKSALLSAISRILQNEHLHGFKGMGVKKILSYIHHNPDKRLSATELSKTFSYHKNYINSLIKSSTGKTLSEYIRHEKTEYAKALLLEGELSPMQVSSMLGYFDYSHFYKAFLAETGTSPSAYAEIKQQ